MKLVESIDFNAFMMPAGRIFSEESFYYKVTKCNERHEKALGCEICCWNLEIDSA